MRYEVTIQRDYLKVMVIPGDVPGDATELLYAVSDAVFQHGRKPILICGPGCSPLSRQELHVLARYVMDTPLRLGKVAFIHDADREFEASRFIDDLRDGQGLDGLDLSVFSTEDEAGRWLSTQTTINGS